MLEHEKVITPEPKSADVKQTSFHREMEKPTEEVALELSLTRNLERKRKIITVDPKIEAYGDEHILYRTECKTGKSAVLRSNYPQIVIDLDLDPDVIWNQIEIRTDAISKEVFKDEWKRRLVIAMSGRLYKRSTIKLIGIGIEDTFLEGLSYLSTAEAQLSDMNVEKTTDGYSKVESISEFLNPYTMTKKFGFEIGKNNSIQTLSLFECVHIAVQMRNKNIFFDKRFFVPRSLETCTDLQIPEIKISSLVTVAQKKAKRVLRGHFLSHSEMLVRGNPNNCYLYKVVSNIH